MVKGGHLRDLKNHINAAYIEAIKRLKDDICDDSREKYFIVTEIDKDNNRRHWYYDSTKCKFEEGLPTIALQSVSGSSSSGGLRPNYP